MYKGEPPRPGLVKKYGPCQPIRVRCTPATNPSGIAVLTPIPPATAFVVGDDIGYNIVDPVTLRMFRADTVRFEEIA
jgi:hypothetical protein